VAALRAPKRRRSRPPVFSGQRHGAIGFTMRFLSDLFAKNRAWAADMVRHDPAFFERLAGWFGPASPRP